MGSQLQASLGFVLISEFKMKCPKCKKELEKIDIEVEDAKSKVKSWQCPDDDCTYIKFDQKTANKVIKEIEEKGSD